MFFKKEVKSQLPFTYEETFLLEIEQGFVPKEQRNKPKFFKQESYILYNGIWYGSTLLKELADLCDKFNYMSMPMNKNAAVRC